MGRVIMTYTQHIPKCILAMTNYESEFSYIEPSHH